MRIFAGMKLYIRNMVCDRCKMVVQQELERSGLQPLSVELGIAEIDRELLSTEKQELNDRLQALGFELIDDRKTRIIEQVKNLVVETIHYTDQPLQVNLSDFLAEQIRLDYSYISNLFTEATGTTIEQYAIAQRIERAKELLSYDELSLSEIADKLYYSSASHFSRQFRKVTGQTPTAFRQSGIQRIPLNRL